jgi:hypothetical protein
MKATNEVTGQLTPIPDCYIYIPNYGRIYLNSLPEISDQKGASYNDEIVIGRATPIKTYSHSQIRSIGLTIHLYALSQQESFENLRKLRAIQSTVYPRSDDTGGAPFAPPVICSLKCGYLFSSRPICVICTNYSVKYPTDVPWDELLYLPIKFDIDTTWEIVYKSSELPGQDKILNIFS